MEIKNKTILTSILIILFTWFTTLRATATDVYGDVNGDGEVSIADVNVVINVILDGSYDNAADVNDDREVSIADINVIISIILGNYIPATETITVNGVSFKMVDVEGGTFTMGATPEQGSDAGSNEKPTHQVTLSSFAIGETEVTQALWMAVMGSNPSCHKGILQRPVEYVSWSDCQTFISTLNQLTGKTFRMPTEAEWEFAARGGNKSQGYKYSGSNNIDDVAWYPSNSYSTPHVVASKAPNELGLYDMSGNVFEWCQDCYGSYSSDAQTNPTGPTSASGYHRVVRGGCWNGYYSNAKACRVSYRKYYPRICTYDFLGLRLAL